METLSKMVGMIKLKVNLIIGRNTNIIHALHKYTFNLKNNFPKYIEPKIVATNTLFNNGLGEELTNYFKYPLLVLQNKDADINHITSQEYAYLGHLHLKNLVVTVFDIFPVTHDKQYTRFNYKFRINMGIKALNKAKKIICISHFTKDELVKKGVPEEKCVVIPLGFNNKIYGKRPYDHLYEKYGLSKHKKYIIHVGSENERKNVVRLVRAIAILKKKNKDIVLLRVGHVQNHVQHKIVLNEINRLGIQDNVKYIGQVTDKELIPLYNLAEISVFPSYYEGFGMPLIEAFACGCPTVTTTGMPMKELAKDAALLADPYSEHDLANKMDILLNDKLLQNKLITKSLDYSKEYSWENITKQTVKVYNSLLNGGGGE